MQKSDLENNIEFGRLCDLERESHLKRFIEFASSMYVLPLFLVFSIADFIWYKAFFWEFLSLRLVTVISFYLMGKKLASTKGLTSVIKISTAAVCFCVLPLHAMVFMIGDLNTPYYAGIMLTTVGISLGLRLDTRNYLLALSLNLIPFGIFGLVNYSKISSTYFALHFLFLFSICLVSFIGRFFIENLSIASLKARQALALEVESRNLIIEQKTKESLKLHALSKQFSPQIIKSIQSGELSLGSDTHRAELCAIFVDIKDSTVKFISLDRDDLQKVLSMYMEDVMGTFLKYDITIDKFLGDGVLGFSNDPIRQSDYIERTVKASVEIYERIQKRSEEYKRYWLSNFELRIGISTGYASVGFYGSDLHVKSYTAIGRVINLVNRVNGVAPVNGIAVSQDVITKLQDSKSTVLRDMDIVDLGVPDLKGFDSEKINVYNLKPKQGLSSNLANQLNSDDPICANGHGLLYIAQTEDGIYNYRCRFCDYILHEEQIKNVA